jgi:VWFA-related protein
VEIAAKNLMRGLVFLAVSFASAQTQEPFRSEVKEVRVPVVVTDGHGHRISDLKVTDFQVFEDGSPEQIVSFRVERQPAALSRDLAPAISPNAPSGTPPTSAQASGVPQRTYLIIVDSLHMAFGNFGQAVKALSKFFETEPAGDAQYVLMTIGREVRVLQDSTRDPAVILAALRAKSFSKVFLDSETNNRTIATEQFVSLMKTYCDACACASAGTTTDSVYCPGIKPRVPLFLTSFSERTLYLNVRFLRQLAEMTRTVARIPTSRTIIFLSDGFNRFPGRELNAVLSGFGPLDRSFQFGTNSQDLQPEIEAVLKIATHDDVKFYTIDSRGVYTQAAAPGTGFEASSGIGARLPEAVISQSMSAARENTDSLAQLARESGGMFFENNNDLLKSIRQAVADGREYYVLSYVAANKAADGKYRRILVTVKGGKLRSQAKEGYWAAQN